MDHEKLMALLGKQIADSGVLKLIQQMLKAGYEAKGQRFETPRGTPQWGVISPLLSNILLTPFQFHHVIVFHFGSLSSLPFHPM